MVSTRPLISKSSSTNSLVTVPSAPITIGFIAPFMFHSFFQFPSNVQVLILLFTFFQFHPVVCYDSKGYNSVSNCEFFHSSFNWWSFTEVWVTSSHLRSVVDFSEILAELNNSVSRMVSILLLISNSSGLFSKPLGTFPSYYYYYYYYYYHTHYEISHSL